MNRKEILNVYFEHSFLWQNTAAIDMIWLISDNTDQRNRTGKR